MSDNDRRMQVTLTLPPNIATGDLITVRGAIFDASTMFVDWERLHHHDPEAIDPAGRLLLHLAAELEKCEREAIERDTARPIEVVKL